MLHSGCPITRPGGFLTTGSGALGWGLPVAVGRALAGTGERVVCVVGDGSSMYSIQALWTAARYRAPVTFVVLNNSGYEAVKELGRRIGIAAGTRHRDPRNRLRHRRRGTGLSRAPRRAGRRPRRRAVRRRSTARARSSSRSRCQPENRSAYDPMAR